MEDDTKKEDSKEAAEETPADKDIKVEPAK